MIYLSNYKNLLECFITINKNKIMYYITYSKLRAFTISLLFLLCFIIVGKAQTITMPNIIGNNMVLQQNTQVPIWGWATAGTSVEVTASWGQTVTILAGTTGKWMTSIQTPVAIPGQAPTYTLTIDGPSNTIRFTNILVGEVWLSSGQSNMWFPINGFYKVVNADAEAAAANYPNIRLFTVPSMGANAPASNCGGSWAGCSPSTAASFSAVSYYFARELYNNKSLNVPIGMIHCSYTGSGIQAWVKDSVLRADVDLKTKYIDNNTNTQEYKKPSLLYNAMISPIIPFAIKGILWYQGESNTSDYYPLYTKANLEMVKDWRVSWGRNLSFYAVQIAPFFYVTSLTDLSGMQAFFREAQTNIMTDPKMGIVSSSDCLQNRDELYVIHYPNKKPVGVRLSLWALAKDYGQSVQYLGPSFQSFAIEGAKIRVSYKPESLGGGLTTKDGLRPACFKICGIDKKFYPALSSIEGNTVVLSSTFVSAPTGIRYAFTDGSMTNLMNMEGIPAPLFRTDNWDYSSKSYVDSPDPNLTITAVENAIIHPFKVIPNPFYNSLRIAGINLEIQNVDIFDITGRKIMSQSGDPKLEMNVDVSDLAKGIYVLRIVKKDMTHVDIKAVKQ